MSSSTWASKKTTTDSLLRGATDAASILAALGAGLARRLRLDGAEAPTVADLATWATAVDLSKARDESIRRLVTVLESDARPDVDDIKETEGPLVEFRAGTSGEFEWRWGIHFADLERTDPQLVATDGGDRQIKLEAVHRRWCRTSGIRHPLAPYVEAWLMRPREVRAETRRQDPILPRVILSPVLPARERGGRLLGGLVPDNKPEALPQALPPLPDERPEPHRVALLELADANGVRSMPRGCGAPLDLRLIVEAVLSVPHEHRKATENACRVDGR